MIYHFRPQASSLRSQAFFRGWLVLLSAAIVGGCNGATQSDPHITEIQQLKDRLAEESRLRVQRDDELAEQAKTIQQLRGMGAQKRLEELVRVERIEIERLSGGYDDNNDGIDDGVVVYLRLVDADGDVIKAAGSAKVRVFDLNRPQGAQLVASGQWTPAELRPLWYGKLMTSHYTLRVGWTDAAKAPPAKMLTMIVDFTDLLSGRSFEARHSFDTHGFASRISK